VNQSMLEVHVQKQALQRLQDSLERARPYLFHAEYSELAKRLLWSRDYILRSAFGQTIDEVLDSERQGFLYSPGYHGWNFNCIDQRLHFVGFFIGHEMIDDGSPCIAYYTYEDGDKVACSAKEERAIPYIDIDTERWGWIENKHRYPILVDEQEVLSVLDFYEQREKKRLTIARQKGELVEALPIDSATQILREFLAANDLLPSSIKHE